MEQAPQAREQPMFKGSFTALITPFKGGQVDDKAFRGLVEWQIAEGTRGLVPVGTTGESPTLSHDEHARVVEWCIDQARGRVPVVAGAGSNSTAEAIEMARHAEQAGADAVLVVTPYYNKPTQEGLYQHFKAINDAIGIPIIIYNIPARSVVDMAVDTMARLFELKNIAGVKDATANVVRVSQQRAAMGPDFNQMSGEDATALGFMAHGGARGDGPCGPDQLIGDGGQAPAHVQDHRRQSQSAVQLRDRRGVRGRHRLDRYRGEVVACRQGDDCGILRRCALGRVMAAQC